MKDWLENLASDIKYWWNNFSLEKLWSTFSFWFIGFWYEFGEIITMSIVIAIVVFCIAWLLSQGL